MTTTTAADLNKTRAAFMQRVSAPNIPPHAFKLAWLIGYRYINRDTRVTFVAQATIARDLNVSVRSVQRLLDILQPLGLMIAVGHGPNRASTYWINPDKATAVSPFKRENTTPLSPIDERKGDTRVAKRRQPVHEKATPVSPLPIKNPKKKEPREESDSRAPVFASLGVSETQATAGLVETEERGRRGRKKKKETAESAETFESFWQAYPKRVAKEAARKAYDKAIEGGVTGATLLAGAQRYAVERQGQPPRYTKHPATWLNAGCWEDELSGAPVIDEAGNVVAIEQEEEERRLSPLERALAMTELDW
jgi:hypothetical protein